MEKLCWLLQHAIRACGVCRLDELQPEEIAAWRMTVSAGYRFEATQALRQVLERAVVWGMLDVNPAKQGVESPQRRRTESTRSSRGVKSTQSPSGSGRRWDRW